MKNAGQTTAGRVFAMFAFIVLSITLTGCMKEMDNNDGNQNPPPANEVYIKSSSFEPVSLSVPAGTTVKWTNNDSMIHTVTSNNMVFDSGNLNAGGTFSFTFNTPGSYAYHCTIHPGMTGTIVVN